MFMRKKQQVFLCLILGLLLSVMLPMVCNADQNGYTEKIIYDWSDPTISKSNYSESISIIIVVKNFNFFRYGLNISDTNEQIAPYLSEDDWAKLRKSNLVKTMLTFSASEGEEKYDVINSIIILSDIIDGVEYELIDFYSKVPLSTHYIISGDTNIDSVRTLIGEYYSATANISVFHRDLLAWKRSSAEKVRGLTVLRQEASLLNQEKSKLSVENKDRINELTKKLNELGNHIASIGYEANSVDKAEKMLKELKDKMLLVNEKISLFEKQYTLTKAVLHTIGPEKNRGGSKITVTLKPVVLDIGSEGFANSRNDIDLGQEVKEFSYYVKSSFPVSFHAGYVFSTISDFEFEKVQKIVKLGDDSFNEDLFQKLDNEEFVQDFAAFLSVELWTSDKLDKGFLATIGTNFTDPGEKLFFGGSYRFKKNIFITGGLSSQIISEGVETIMPEKDENEPTQADVTFFRRLFKERDYGFFISVSFGIF